VPFARRFDFGLSGSPVAEGYTAVLPTTGYSSLAGHGWLGFVQGVDRGAALGSALTRDLHFERQLTFLVDVPEATYDVTLTLGDVGPYHHDLMSIALEGTPVGVVSTAAGQVITVSYRVAVKDGQLTISLTDQGGTDVNAVLNGLEIVWAGPAGPRVVALTPSGTVQAPLDRLSVTWDEPIQDGSFSLADVLSLTGPAGAIPPLAVNRLSATRYEVVFAAQSLPGDYQVVLAAQIADLAGHLMDQDGDGTGGEEPQDRFTGSFRLVPVLRRFDFGVAGSPVAEGYAGVTPATGYSGSLGYGWLGGTVQGVDRGVGTALTRDLNFERELRFGVDVPEATYDVTLTLGDTGPYAHDQMAVFLEGIQVDTVSTAAGEIRTVTYRGIRVSDGQLNLQLVDLGGSDPNVVISGLEILWAAPLTTAMFSTAGPMEAVLGEDPEPAHPLVAISGAEWESVPISSTPPANPPSRTAAPVTSSGFSIAVRRKLKSPANEPEVRVERWKALSDNLLAAWL
jgi:fibronectin type 3 domain-containing protein